MTEYNRVRDNLKTLTVDEVSTTQIFDASKVIFLSKEAVEDAKTLDDIATFYRGVHAITYGNTIPNTGVQVEGLTDGDGIEPSLNEVISILGVALGNNGGSPIEVAVKLGDLPLIVTAVAPGGTTTSSELGAIFPIHLSKGNALKFEVVTGTGTDLNAIVQYNKTVQ